MNDLNTSGSKLDAFLQRSLTYEVGRCPDKNDRDFLKDTVI